MTSLKTKTAALVAAAAMIAAPFEGLRQWAYKDPVGIPTICFGATKGVKMGQYATLEQCEAYLDRDMTIAVQAVQKCAPEAPDRVVIGFASAVYNLGPTISCNLSESTAARLLKAKEWDKACKQLPRWDKATVAGVKVTLPGLTKRRLAEEKVCLNGVN